MAFAQGYLRTCISFSLGFKGDTMEGEFMLFSFHRAPVIRGLWRSPGDHRRLESWGQVAKHRRISFGFPVLGLRSKSLKFGGGFAGRVRGSLWCCRTCGVDGCEILFVAEGSHHSRACQVVQDFVRFKSTQLITFSARFFGCKGKGSHEF